MKTYQSLVSAGKKPQQLSALGLGCSRIGSFSNPTPLAQVRATLESALDLGINVFDTADIYGQGDSERELGRLLKGRRDRGFVVTKAGKQFSGKMRLLAPLKPVLKPLLAARGGSAVAGQREGQMAEDFRPRHLVEALDRSLGRLGFEQVDGFLLHSPPAEAAADPAVAEALSGLVKAGKIERFGVSCDDMACLKAALTIPGLSLLQLPLDLLDAADAEGLDLKRATILIFAREAIRLQPEVPPPVAVARALGRKDVDIVVAGASTASHLSELATACA